MYKIICVAVFLHVFTCSFLAGDHVKNRPLGSSSKSSSFHGTDVVTIQVFVSCTSPLVIESGVVWYWIYDTTIA